MSQTNRDVWWNPLFSQEGREFLTGMAMVLGSLAFFLVTIVSCAQQNNDRDHQKMTECLAKDGVTVDDCYRFIHGHNPDPDGY